LAERRFVVEQRSAAVAAAAAAAAMGNCAVPARDPGVEQSSTNSLLFYGTTLTNGTCAQPLSSGFARQPLHGTNPRSDITQCRWERIGSTTFNHEDRRDTHKAIMRSQKMV